jgi:hypothetical protein
LKTAVLLFNQKPGTDMNKPTPPKPILLYDHLPGILAIYPAILFLLLALLSLPYHRVVPSEQAENFRKAVSGIEGVSEESIEKMVQQTYPALNSHMLFWIGLSMMVVWYIAYRYNLPKSKFIMVFGLLGTFVGIPVVLELSGYFKLFTKLGNYMWGLEPTLNAGGWIAMSVVFFVIFLINFIYSRTHMRVRIDESGLTINRLGGKGERFELIGLKTENEPLDYLELFIAGIGSLSLKTRMNKPIFTMKRVIGLYRIPWFPFFKGKLARIEEILSYQGKVSSVSTQDKIDMAAQEEAENLPDDFGDLGDDAEDEKRW